MRAVILTLLVLLGFAGVAYASNGGSWMITGIAAQFSPSAILSSVGITWGDTTVITWGDGTILIEGS